MQPAFLHGSARSVQETVWSWPGSLGRGSLRPMAAIPIDLTGATIYSNGTADVTLSSGDTYSSNLPDPRPVKDDLEEDAKGFLKALLREDSLDACHDLAELVHGRLRGSQGPPGVAARPPRPTQRRTATATRNWRRQC